jgi:hypothetical protein
MVDTVYRIAGQPRTLLRQVHPLLLRLAALSNRTVQELLEMQYQFDEPFLVDSTKINIELGVRATPIEQALADTLASYSERQPGRPTRSVGGSRRLGYIGHDRLQGLVGARLEQRDGQEAVDGLRKHLGLHRHARSGQHRGVPGAVVS